VATLCVTDADGFKTVPPRRSGQRLGDYISNSPAPRCNNNRFRPLSLEDWQEVAATIAEKPKIQSSEALTPPTLASAACFPSLSRSTSLSPSLLAAPASCQGEKIAVCAHTHSQIVHFEDFVVAESYFHEESACRHAELNSAKCSRVGLDKCFEDVVGDGGFIPIKHIDRKRVSFAQAAAIASASVSAV
jgi:hypothetical protein